jgi:nucleotide-binding universal stress UspA family protein
MPQVDQFESVFRSAVKDVFVYSAVTLQKILVVADIQGEQANAFVDKIKYFVRVLGDEESIEWQVVTGDQFQTTEDVLNIANDSGCDLICTYRNLHSKAWQFPHSLGAHLDVLVQKSTVPVLVLPHPKAGYAFEHALEHTNKVMAVTDHLSNDHALVNYGVKFTQQGGKLFLVHIENQIVFDRYIDAISKIPSIETDQATQLLKQQLLKMPRDYTQSCRRVLSEAGVDVEIIAHVEFGHHLAQYCSLVENEKIDLLVMHTKDDEQSAMHGLAYPLAVEIRQIPLLML